MRLLRLALLCLTVGCKAEPTEKRQLAPLERVQPMNPFSAGKLVYPGQGIVQIEGTEQREGKSFVRLKHSTMAIRDAVEVLKRLPFAGPARHQKDASLRELVIPYGRTGYVVLYRVGPGAVVSVLAARHQLEEGITEQQSRL